MYILSDKHCIIGEGPIWNPFDNRLYHVDGFANEIVEIDIDTKKVKTRKLPFGVAAIAFSQKGEMLISCADGAYILHPDNTRTPLYNTKKHSIRFGNDAKVGPDGRFYIGTQSSRYYGCGDAVDGKLYQIDHKGNVTTLLDGLGVSNGLDWSVDERRFYHTDSVTGIIKEYSFDKKDGCIAFTGRQVVVQNVDGLTVGADDCIHAACWGRGLIAVIDTADMQVKRYVEVPAIAPASCCFAGKEMDKFVVVTASYRVDLEEDKNAGYTFIGDVNIKGRKPYLFG